MSSAYSRNRAVEEDNWLQPLSSIPRPMDRYSGSVIGPGKSAACALPKLGISQRFMSKNFQERERLFYAIPIEEFREVVE